MPVHDYKEDKPFRALVVNYRPFLMPENSIAALFGQINLSQTILFPFKKQSASCLRPLFLEHWRRLFL
jgi:hypothetical protein